jgi:cytidyltransferase-like protein
LNISDTPVSARSMFRSDDFKSRFRREESAIIFGGTFDPIHSGHVQDIRSLMKLADRVYIAPTEQNPWKKDIPTSLENRIQMIRMVLQNENIPFSEDLRSNNGLILLTTPYVFAAELTRKLSSETDKTLFWAIGEDLAEHAPSWKDWSSHGIPFVILPLLKGTSSTLTRASKIPPHPAIIDYIKEKNLYLPPVHQN